MTVQFVRPLQIPVLGDAHWPSNASQIYTSKRMLLLPKFLNTNQTAYLIQQVADLPVRWASVYTNPTVTWANRDIPPLNSVAQAFSSFEVVTAICATLGMRLSRLGGTVTWCHEYQGSEYIAEHTDVAGTTQLVVCLYSQQANRNVFYVNPSGCRQQIALGAGDALLFDAKNLKHGTTAVAASIHPNCRRVVLVTRYHFSSCLKEFTNTIKRIVSNGCQMQKTDTKK